VLSRTTLNITLTPARSPLQQRWTLPNISPANLLRAISTKRLRQGWQVTLLALAPGTSTLTSSGAPLADPHGPPTQTWSIQIKIQQR
jgi:hypothetical protein